MSKTHFQMSNRNWSKQVVGLVSRQLEAKRKKEDAAKQANDPVLVEKIRSVFMQSSNARASIFLNMISENYAENPAYLNPVLFNEFLSVDPAAAVKAVELKHNEQAQIESAFSTGPARRIVGRAFKLDPKLINQENFDLVASLFQHNLNSLDKDENGLEKFCRNHPDLAKNNKRFQDIDFVQRQTERDLIRDASVKESHFDLYGSKKHWLVKTPKPKQ